MDDSRVVAILSALAKGVNPFTGEVAAPDSPYQHADVVRALYAALERFKSPAETKTRPRPDLPANVGKPWSEEDDRRLIAEFDRGRKPTELAREFGRTLAGIEARLERLGRISAAERRTVNRFSNERRNGNSPAVG
ncbi:MAG TPA: hypothetical protein VIL28_07010 [Steroidobacteraceae bacterium]